MDDDYCSMDCLTVTGACGDAEQQPNEACDDGNNNDQDACRNQCILARCGDGVQHVGVEACDDGNNDDDDICSNS